MSNLAPPPKKWVSSSLVNQKEFLWFRRANAINCTQPNPSNTIVIVEKRMCFKNLINFHKVKSIQMNLYFRKMYFHESISSSEKMSFKMFFQSTLSTLTLIVFNIKNVCLEQMISRVLTQPSLSKNCNWRDSSI